MFAYTADGGVPPYVFSLASGSLPTGLTLHPNGTVTGSYDVAGTYSWLVQVSDSANQTATFNDAATVNQSAVFAAGRIDSPPPGMNDLAFTSVNGSSWSAGTYVRTGTQPANTIFIQSCNGRIFSIGSLGGTPRVSTDSGITWQPLIGIPAYNASSIMFTGTEYLLFMQAFAPDSQKIWVSSNGVNFSPRVTGLALGNARYGSVRRGPTIIVCGVPNYSFEISHDYGMTWVSKIIGGVDRSSCIADSGTAFVANIDKAADSDLYRSIDGNSWATIQLPANTGIGGIAYGKGRFVCMNRSGGSYYSIDDGLTWAVGGAAFGGQLNSLDLTSFTGSRLIYANGIFIAAGSLGRIWTSPDSVTWTEKLNTSSASPICALTEFKAD